MPRFIKVRPLDGRKIKDPVTERFISTEGDMVEDSPFWRSRAKNNEVEIVRSSAVASPPVDQADAAKDEAKTAKKGNK